MFTMKRSASHVEIEPEPEGEVEVKRKVVSLKTFQKWRTEMDRDLKTISWLSSSEAIENGKKIVKELKCSVCAKFRIQIMSRRNFSDYWITGASSIRTSNIRDHAKSDQHLHAMSLFQRERFASNGPSSSTAAAPIVVALTTLQDDERARLRKKMDVAYFVAKEKMSFRKYPSICALEARHGVDLGTNYVTAAYGKQFTHYIAQSLRNNFKSCIQNVKFFSLLFDASTDAANIENEMFLIAWFDRCGENEMVCTRTSFLTVVRPLAVTANGLMEVFKHALSCLDINSVSKQECAKLVGVGTDGASANIAASGGLKGLVEKELPWIFWMWCLGHRLELAIKGALQQTSFDLVDDMLLRLYLLYEKSSKKCRELQEIVTELRECYHLEGKGMRPIRANGTRWVSHKYTALKRILMNYGAYTSHLASLSVDTSVKSVDREKLKCYYRKWTDAKYIIGCAFYVDVLYPCSILSKALQNDNLDILSALTGILRAMKELDKFSLTAIDQWPTYASIIAKCTQDPDTEHYLYQSQELKNFTAATLYYTNHAADICERVSVSIHFTIHI